MTSVKRSQHPAVLLGAMGLLAACASVDTAPPERIADLRAKGKACNQALPDVAHFDVDRYGEVQVWARGPEAALIERNFRDCVAAQGRWAKWAAGDPAPMLDPPGPDNPDANPGLRIP